MTFASRLTIRVLSPTSYTTKYEVATDGASWVPFWEGKVTATDFALFVVSLCYQGIGNATGTRLIRPLCSEHALKRIAFRSSKHPVEPLGVVQLG